ncbi:transporter substrate-binding domain-containing protein [uncultured Thiohalocapsa sp.]|uniref:transporter substrate-binding domain-containing protein n=1 Tax=uncultured Thiohalocapsa sp. TaxID=768990 RepID=UPI0025D527D5|nr:transporter substrate-binding domain-containing protein [uncultured Thiohalocapsa sp.]
MTVAARMLALALLLAAAPGLADLRIGVFGQDPPFSFVDENGALAGFDIDIAEALCAQARFECELVPTDWGGLLRGLEERDLDAVVASVAITEARRERVLFTRPYYRSQSRFVAPAGGFDAVTPAALMGKRIGVWRDTTMDAYLSANYAGHAVIVRYSTQLGALLDLVLGRVDLVLGDALSLQRNFLDTPHAADFELVGPPIDAPEWLGDGIGVAVARHNRGLRQLLDRTIADIHVNGVFERIRRRWLDTEADVAGRPRSAGD